MNVKDKYYQEVLRFWKDLTPNQRELVDHSIIKKHFNKGEAMRSSSDQCSGLFLIESGQVRAYIISETKGDTLYRLFDRDVCIFSASCIMKILVLIFYRNRKETTAILYLLQYSISFLRNPWQFKYLQMN